MNDSGLTYLQPGDVFEHGGEEYLVTKVNDCRALCYPIAKRERTITPTTGPNAGKTIKVQSTGAPIGISPNSFVKILRREKIKNPVMVETSKI